MLDAQGGVVWMIMNWFGSDLYIAFWSSPLEKGIDFDINLSLENQRFLPKMQNSKYWVLIEKA